jgi:hypothetical protein
VYVKKLPTQRVVNSGGFSEGGGVRGDMPPPKKILKEKKYFMKKKDPVKTPILNNIYFQI